MTQHTVIVPASALSYVSRLQTGEKHTAALAATPAEDGSTWLVITDALNGMTVGVTVEAAQWAEVTAATTPKPDNGLSTLPDVESAIKALEAAAKRESYWEDHGTHGDARLAQAKVDTHIARTALKKAINASIAGA